MRVVIAMDSFKGSLSSIEAGKAVAEGVRRADGTIECVVCPVADGGEGTSAALTEGLHGETVRVRVTGPLGEKVTAEYGVKGDLAILEMAQAAGLPLVPQDKRNPMKTTTYGVGEMLRDAINRGCKRFILGIGGSATNDGGAGMLQALGFDLLDKDGNPVPFGAEGLRVLAKIENKNALPALKNCVIRAACDVTNPLCGENGAGQRTGFTHAAEHIRRAGRNRSEGGAADTGQAEKGRIRRADAQRIRHQGGKAGNAVGGGLSARGIGGRNGGGLAA